MSTKLNPALASVSLEDLKREVQFRQEEIARLVNERHERVLNALVENAEAFLTLATEHERTSCSDEHPTNANPVRCTRCFLLLASRYKHVASEDVDVTFSITGKR